MHGIFHTILAGATVGIFFLAVAAYVFRFVLKDGESLNARRADTVTLVSAATGTVIGALALLTGLLATWPFDAITGTLLAQNKLLASITAVVALGMVWLLRVRAGRGMWTNRATRLWSAVLMLIALVNVGLAGSMGGSAALKGTALDPLLIAVRINRYVSLSWGPALSIAVIVLSLAVLAYAQMRAGKSAKAAAQ
jgi:hypothetical protein